MKIFNAPFNYYRLVYKGKLTHDLLIPLCMAMPAGFLILGIPGEAQILGENGLFDKFTQFLPILGGFYIAALTVILTQDHKALKSKIIGSNAPKLPSDGESLTRARFLAILFGYLSFASFFLFLLIISVETLAPGFSKILPAGVQYISKISVVLIVLFLLSQIFVATMIGLYYMSDRLYRSDQQASFRKKIPPA
ncbi:hypothetical protein [Sphingorhabdus sp. YGSMI21]|uniref:hypothetical protein n=1 Tax=Sphingorhabdus sp. YGSMI21 TaxID=2077182 RepID=UPI000C1EC381|nr:hypothetical protein [Sphingorhabdus sp. YGSMI21]ATW02359.1 hypothetical protein CHN51_01580 [Sphingorhabdus sp. YGSMI21]